MSAGLRSPSRDELIGAARKLWGAENAAMSSRRELRFGQHGSKSLDLDKLTWFDHEATQGGGYVELFRMAGIPLPNGEDTGITATYDYRDERGVLLFQVVRKPGKKFLQRRPDPTEPSGWKWDLHGVRRVLYRLPELLAAAKATTVFIVEGEKDVDNLRAHMLVATCNPGGAAEHKDKAKPYRGKWLAEFSEYLRGHHARILADNDAPGEAHALDVARKLHGIAASVRIVRLPGLPPKDDVSDWLNAGNTIEELDRIATETEPFDDPELEVEGRTILKIVKGEFVQIAEKIEAIATAAKLPIYSHGETLCRPVAEQRKRHDGQIVTVAALRNYTAASLRRALDPAMEFRKFDARRKVLVPCEPPADIINMVLAGEQKQIFPPIRGIIGTPILRPERTFVAIEGYDADTGYYLLDPPKMPPIPAAPTRDDAETAVAVLRDLLSEFPFADQVSESVAFSGLITPLVRAACDVVPGHLFTAPKQGSGKSLLVDVASAIATGERAYAILAHRQPEEQDKQLTGALLEARQFVVLDNLMGEIESPVLAQATEREYISLRPLGTSQTVRIANSFNCYLTGNNTSPGGDNTRRILVGRVDPQVENPLDRTFAKPNPVIRVFANRGAYVAACLTIVIAYIAQGRPNKLNPIPSYGAWSELVREPLVWLGLWDPIDSMRTAFDDDPANAALATLITAWPANQTDWTCAELIEAAMKADEHGPVFPGLAEALKPVARDRRGNFDATTLGHYLRMNRDKIVGGRKITRHPMGGHGGITRWMLA